MSGRRSRATSACRRCRTARTSFEQGSVAPPCLARRPPDREIGPVTIAVPETRAESAPAMMAYGLLVVAMLAWSGNLIVGRGLAGTVGPFTMGWTRWLIALLIVLPFAARELVQKRAVLRRDSRLLLVLGAVGFGCSNTFCYLALQSTTAVNASLINAAGPLLTFAGSALFLREPFGWRQLVGLAIAVLGVLAVILHGDLAAVLALEANPGDLFMLAGVATWAVYSILLRWRPAELSPVALVTALFGIGLVCLTPFALWEWAQGGAIHPTPAALAGLVYLGIFPSVVSILCWNRAVALVGPARASVFNYVMPLFVAALALFFLGEQIRLFHLWGGALIFLGLGLALAPRRS
jgi:drug/metabolite transporter (DMT)-like permease